MPFKARYANTGAGVSGASRICDASAFKAAWFLLSQSSIVSYVEDLRVSIADSRTLVNCGMFIFHLLWFSAINERAVAPPLTRRASLGRSCPFLLPTPPAPLTRKYNDGYTVRLQRRVWYMRFGKRWPYHNPHDFNFKKVQPKCTGPFGFVYSTVCLSK